MKRWSKEERALKSYFEAQVEQEKCNFSKKNPFWKETVEQLAVMVAGIAVIIPVGQFQKFASQPFARGIEIVAELFRSFTAL